MQRRHSIRVVQIGLGPIGQQMVQELDRRRAIELVASVDIDPEMRGRDSGEVAGLGRSLGVTVVGSLGDVQTSADVACVTTTSSLRAAARTIIACCERGLAVVSTCEELSYPWQTQPSLAREIDEAARDAGVAVLGTGVNPGFVMDLLPVVATGASSRVDSIRVERYQDAGLRRRPFQLKVGAGLTKEEFDEKARDGSIRHVGLTESMHMIAHRMGWSIDRTADGVEPVIGTKTVTGVHQVGRAWSGNRVVIELVFHAEVGLPDPADRIVVSGAPSFEVVVPGGFHGDQATGAIVANSMPRVLDAPPGLRTMIDIMPLSWYEEG